MARAPDPIEETYVHGGTTYRLLASKRGAWWIYLGENCIAHGTDQAAAMSRFGSKANQSAALVKARRAVDAMQDEG